MDRWAKAKSILTSMGSDVNGLTQPKHPYLFPGGSGGLDATPGVRGIPERPPSEILPTELNIPPAGSKGPGEGRPGDVGTISIWDP